MNIFRLAGDMTHLMCVLVLLLKIHTIKSCAGHVDILPIFGSSCNTSSAGIVAKDKKYRQLDCSICFSPRSIQSILHPKLDLPLLHGASLCSLDNMDIWIGTDIALCRFRLLLLQ
ncbi:unnamed protein product [Musa textilis]